MITKINYTGLTTPGQTLTRAELEAISELLRRGGLTEVTGVTGVTVTGVSEAWSDLIRVFEAGFPGVTVPESVVRLLKTTSAAPELLTYLQGVLAEGTEVSEQALAPLETLDLTGKASIGSLVLSPEAGDLLGYCSGLVHLGLGGTGVPRAEVTEKPGLTEVILPGATQGIKVAGCPVLEITDPGEVTEIVVSPEIFEGMAAAVRSGGGIHGVPAGATVTATGGVYTQDLETLRGAYPEVTWGGDNRVD